MAAYSTGIGGTLTTRTDECKAKIERSDSIISFEIKAQDVGVTVRHHGQTGKSKVDTRGNLLS